MARFSIAELTRTCYNGKKTICEVKMRMFFFDEDYVRNESLFESIRHVNEYGQEFWYARELQKVLEYAQWRRFSDAIERAKEACANAGFEPDDHFADVGKMVEIGSGAEREIDDISLSRYACYLIAMNGDPRKEVIALAQTYFAVKTRQHELIENYDQLSEDQKRLSIRREMVEHNKSLAEAAQNAGVVTQKGLCHLPEQGLSGAVRRSGSKGNPRPKGFEEGAEHPRSHGQHRAGCESFPRHADR